MITMGMLSSVAFVLMVFDFPIPFLFPSFLKIDLSDVPAIVGTFAMGPVIGVIIELIKNLLYLIIKGTTSGGIGEIANFTVGISYVIPLGLILRWNKSERKALYGLLGGLLSMVVFGVVANYLFFIPAYSEFYGMPIDGFVDMSAAINPMITDFKTMVLYAITPFNILKGIMIALIGYKLYDLLKGSVFNRNKTK